MARTAKILDFPVQEPTLEDLIQQAGELNAAKNQANGAYEKVKKDIFVRMPQLTDETQEQIRQATDYEACLWMQEKTIVDLKKLHRLHNDIFWRLISIPVGELEKDLSGEDFRTVTSIKKADKPTLTIRKIKKEKISA